MAKEADGLTTKEAADVLGVTPERVRQLARDGRLKFTETRFGRLFDRRSVEKRRAERARGDAA